MLLMKTTAIKDDNLRLVLSVGHKQWLDGEARHHWTSLCVSASLLIFNILAWIALRHWDDLAMEYPFLALACLISPIWIITLSKAAIELRKIAIWRKGHEAFLASYNRSPADYKRGFAAAKQAA